MPSSPSSDVFLSIRTSCDRCRFQKLKCLIPESSGEAMCCQRCARAMVPCIFGRRNKSRRKRASAISISEETNLSKKMLSQSPCPSPTSKDIATNSGDPVARSMEQEQYALDGIAEQWHAENEQLNYPFQEDSTMSDLWLFTNDISFGSQGLGTLGLAEYGFNPALASDVGIKDSATSSPTLEALMMAPEGGTATKLLLNLASELYENHEALSSGKWQEAEACRTLDGYPIGSVYHLSQKFIDLGTALQKLRSGSEAPLCGKVPPATWKVDRTGTLDFKEVKQGAAALAASPPSLDPSVTLILMSCFVTLTRLYSTILGHFQLHLSLQPMAPANASRTSMDMGPTLCLGELQPTNTCYSRVYTAVGILLDLLRQAEEALRFAGGLQPLGTATSETSSEASIERELVSALVSWEALTTASGIQEALAALEKQVTDIKDLVRENMGL